MIKKQIITLTFSLFCSLTFAQTDSSKSLMKQTLPIDTVFIIKKIEIVNKSFDTLVADYKLKKSTEINATNFISSAFSGIALFLTILGWIFSPMINRKTKALEKQLELRLEMLNAVIEFRNDFIKNKNFNQYLFDKFYLLFQLYGKKYEQKKADNLVENLENYKNCSSKIEGIKEDNLDYIQALKNKDDATKMMEGALVELVLLCRDSIRVELKLERNWLAWSRLRQK
jgi:hypothetical protein